MNDIVDDLGHFEQRLLSELRAEITTTAPANRRRTRRRRYLLAGAAAAAIVAGIAAPIVIGHGSSQAAFALETTPDGLIQVTINRIDDAAGLQSGLEANGVDAVVDYTPTGKVCRHPRFTPAPSSQDGQSLLVVGQVGAAGDADGPHSLTFQLDPADYAGRTMVIELSGQSGAAPTLDGPKLVLGTAVGPVAPCVLVDAPSS